MDLLINLFENESMSIKDISRADISHSNMSKNNISFDIHFTYEILQTKHIDQVVEVFTKAFCRSEPMTAYLEMDENKYKIFARAVAEQAYKDKLSVVALDDDKVVAIALTEDLAAPGPLPDFDPKFENILSLLEHLGKNFFANKVFKRGHIAHLFITAVDDDYRNLGLSKQVNFRAMDLAAQLGFDFIYCELTNFFNEKGLIPHLKNKKRLVGSIEYHKFYHKNEKPFENLIGGANSFLWEIRPDADLKYMQGNDEICDKNWNK